MNIKHIREIIQCFLLLAVLALIFHIGVWAKDAPELDFLRSGEIGLLKRLLLLYAGPAVFGALLRLLSVEGRMAFRVSWPWLAVTVLLVVYLFLENWMLVGSWRTLVLADARYALSTLAGYALAYGLVGVRRESEP